MLVLILGKHVSISGGINTAPERAQNLGANCLQIFVKNPRGWKARTLDDKEISSWKENIEEFKIKSTVVHDTYLINPASPKDELWKKSVECMQKEYHRCARLGIDYYVIHPGSHTGSGNKKGINRIAEAVNRTLDSRPEANTILLLENVAGSGTAVGSNLFELYDIINNVKAERRVGVCFDTCHAFTAGYNLSRPEKADEVLHKAGSLFGPEKIFSVHINDSVYGHSSRRDEHAHIGEGEISEAGLKCVVNHPVVRDTTFIVEVPPLTENSDRDRDIDKLLSMRR
ncbi:MAG: deoxyribonuclease IV [Halanaerobiales bacterium]